MNHNQFGLTIGASAGAAFIVVIRERGSHGLLIVARLWGSPRVNWLAAVVTGCGLTGCVLAFADAGPASVDAVAGVLTGALLLGYAGVASTHPWGGRVRVY